MTAAAGVPAGLTRQSEVTADLRIDCGVVIVGSGPAGRPWPPSSLMPESMS